MARSRSSQVGRGAEIKGAAGYLLAICALIAETLGGEFSLDTRLLRYQEPRRGAFACRPSSWRVSVTIVAHSALTRQIGGRRIAQLNTNASRRAYPR